MLQEEYWSVIQSRICKRCVDGNGYGDCRLPEGEECRLHHFLPDIIRTVTETRSDKIEEYVARLRKNICAICDYQAPDQVCLKRNQLECALDRYFPLVVEIIEMIKEDGARVPSI